MECFKWASVTDELNFQLYLIVINLNVGGFIWPVAALLHSTVVGPSHSPHSKLLTFSSPDPQASLTSA